MSKQNLTTKPKERLASLDVLRGFDMFWIIGGGSLIIALSELKGWSWLEPVAEQLHHVKWEGFHFYDLIFPLFMFISGVAIPYAIISKRDKGASKSSLAWKIVRRGLTLVILGMIYNGALRGSPDEIRVASVLGQIGLAYMFAALIFLYTTRMSIRLAWLFGILVLISVLQLFVPVPGYGAGVLDPVSGINVWLDGKFLPGVLYFDIYDPEGLLCIVSAITVTMAGGIAGMILRDGKPANLKKVYRLLITGAVLIVVAVLLSPYYPIVKNAWTATFNMLTAGISFALLGMFYLVIDVAKWSGRLMKPILFFFMVIGMNSITIYMATALINFHYTSNSLLGWLSTSWGSWVTITGVIVIEWLLLYYLYKKKIFLRV
ncbi:MAG: DUF5009 domain-containing protein [Bacteroidales bacterium]|nr:DUF5009 domain-containing protein [Bacteroidales bacterium]